MYDHLRYFSSSPANISNTFIQFRLVVVVVEIARSFFYIILACSDIGRCLAYKLVRRDLLRVLTPHSFGLPNSTFLAITHLAFNFEFLLVLVHI